jgi:predicted nucleic acid-binding protein
LKLVLDSSATLAFVHGDERTATIEAIFDRVAEHSAIVPNLWHLEIANSLTIAIWRKRMSAQERMAALLDLAQLDITVDDNTATHAWKAAMQLADLHSLSVYDVACLELAQRMRLPLATLDKALIRAGHAAGVALA